MQKAILLAQSWGWIRRLNQSWWRRFRERRRKSWEGLFVVDRLGQPDAQVRPIPWPLAGTEPMAAAMAGGVYWILAGRREAPFLRTWSLVAFDLASEQFTERPLEEPERGWVNTRLVAAHDGLVMISESARRVSWLTGGTIVRAILEVDGRAIIGATAGGRPLLLDQVGEAATLYELSPPANRQALHHWPRVPWHNHEDDVLLLANGDILVAGFVTTYVCPAGSDEWYEPSYDAVIDVHPLAQPGSTLPG